MLAWRRITGKEGKPVSLTQPVWLLLLVIVAGLLYWDGFVPMRKQSLSKGKHTKKNQKPQALQRLTLLRALALTAVILALAGACVVLPTKQRQVVVMIDVSDSMGKAQIETARNQALQLLRKLTSADRVALVAFAGEPRLVLNFDLPDNIAANLETTVLDAAQPELTNLQAALLLGKELLNGRPGNRSIILYSDGRSNTGGELASTLMNFEDIKIHVLALGTFGSGLVAQGLELPETVHPEEKVIAHWQLFTDAAQQIWADIKLDGTIIRREQFNLKPGFNKLPLLLQCNEPGVHQVELEAFSFDGQPLKQADYGAMLKVAGPLEVLLVRDERAGTALAAALRTQGIQVREIGVAGLAQSSTGFTGYGAVILDNIRATDLTEVQQKAVESFVAGGGGLLVIGGEQSLGRGEYYASSLEKLLPVHTDTRQRLFFNKAQILFVLDHSGSMAEMVGNTSKQLAAMQGVAAAIRELNPHDQVGIMSFDTSPNWVLPFTTVRDRETILEALSHAGEGGGTDLSHAMQEIIDGFGSAGPNRRHVIILTDGLTSGNREAFRKLSLRLKANQVTITTIGIGAEINADLLKSIAQWGEGTFYRAELDQIPQMIRKETVRVSRDLIQEGRFKPVVKTEAALVEGLGTNLPVLRGYLITKPKNLATIYLEAGNKNDPLLADWRYGNGRVAVFTSDSGNRWLKPWSGSPLYNRLWTQLIRAIERRTPDSGLRIQAKAEAGAVRIVVEATDAKGNLQSGLQLQGQFLGDNTGFVLPETVPGRYETTMTLPGFGLQSFEVRDRLSGNWNTGWIWNPPGEELQVLGPDYALLSYLCANTGGVELTAVVNRLPDLGWSWMSVDLTFWLISFALLIFLIELGYRSTSPGQVAMVRAMLNAWWQRQQHLIRMVKKRQWETDSASQSQPEETFSAYRYLAQHSQRYQRNGSSDPAAQDHPDNEQR